MPDNEIKKPDVYNDKKLELLHNGELYDCTDPYIVDIQGKCMTLLTIFNQLAGPLDEEVRAAFARKMFAAFGEGSHIEGAIKANWAGVFCHIGSHVYINNGLTLVDDTHIYIEDFVQLGPNVTLVTATHPLDPDLRMRGYQYNLPVTLKKNCWLGAGVIVLPGVTIGENAVIGAGSTVTRDIPAHCVAYGTPCRKIHDISFS